MSKEQPIKNIGQVVEALPNGQFLVSVEGNVIRCYLNGKMRLNKIKVIIGDSVNVELSPGVDLKNALGRITFRNK